MIGHWLMQLRREEEDRVLTGVMRPGSYAEMPDSEAEGGLAGPCLVGRAAGCSDDAVKYLPQRVWPPFTVVDGTLRRPRLAVEERYDDLCARFGAGRVNDVIRQRVLANRVRRALDWPVGESRPLAGYPGVYVRNEGVQP